MSDYLDTHCFLCGKFKNMEGKGHERCVIWSFRGTDGWLSLVNGYHDELEQMDDIEYAWDIWLLKVKRESICLREYDIVCTCCGRNHISNYDMPGECFRCSTVKEEL